MIEGDNLSGKKFKFRVDLKNNIGVKVNKNISKSEYSVKKSVTVGLDKNFNLLDRYIIKDNIFTPYSIDMKLRKGRGGQGIYYMMDKLSYLATVSANYNKKGTIIGKSLILYIPKMTFSEQELYFVRVTGEIDREKYNELLNELIGITNF